MPITAAGIISKRWWRSDAVTSPGALAVKLSRRARHHGAIFAVPAKDTIVPGGNGIIQSRKHEIEARRRGQLSRRNYHVMRRKNCDKLINYDPLVICRVTLKVSRCTRTILSSHYSSPTGSVGL